MYPLLSTTAVKLNKCTKKTQASFSENFVYAYLVNVDVVLLLSEVVVLLLIVNLPDDLLKDVLQGHHPSGTSVLVDDDGHVQTPPPHLGGQGANDKGEVYFYEKTNQRTWYCIPN